MFLSSVYTGIPWDTKSTIKKNSKFWIPFLINFSYRNILLKNFESLEYGTKIIVTPVFAKFNKFIGGSSFSLDVSMSV